MIVNHRKAAHSDKLHRLSREADVAYTRMLGCADQFGRAEYNPRTVLAAVFPRRRDVYEGNVRRWLEEYERVRSPLDPAGAGLIRTYLVDGVTYFEFTKWKGYAESQQKIMKCPPPPWAPAKQHDAWTKLTGGRRAPRQLDLAGTSPDPLPDLSSTSLNGGPAGSETSGESTLPTVVPVVSETTTPPSPPLARGGLRLVGHLTVDQLQQLVAQHDAGEVSTERFLRALVDFVAAIAKRQAPGAAFVCRTDRRVIRRMYLAGQTLEAIVDAQLQRVHESLQRQGIRGWDVPAPRAADELHDRPPPRET